MPSSLKMLFVAIISAAALVSVSFANGNGYGVPEEYGSPVVSENIYEPLNNNGYNYPQPIHTHDSFIRRLKGVSNTFPARIRYFSRYGERYAYITCPSAQSNTFVWILVDTKEVKFPSSVPPQTVPIAGGVGIGVLAKETRHGKFVAKNIFTFESARFRKVACLQGKKTASVSQN